MSISTAIAELPALRGIPREERSEVYSHNGFWDEISLVRRFDEWAYRQPDALAVVDLENKRQTSFKRLQDDSRKVANLLRQQGVVPGDVVAVQLPNWYEAVAIGLGVLRAGAVLNPLIPIYAANELRLMLDVGKTRVIFTPLEYRGSDYVGRVHDVTRESGRSFVHFTIDDPSLGARSLDDLLEDVPDIDESTYPEAENVSELLFTSGTESLPKAILHSEQTLCCAIREMGKFLGLRSHDVVWMPMPVGHSTGLNYGIRMALYHGLKLVLQDRWNAEVAVKLCEENDVTYTAVSPTFLHDMLSVLRKTSGKLPKLRYFGCSGAPIPQGMVEDAAEFGISVLRGYGSTESLAAVKQHPDFALEKRARADGKPIPGTELELRLENGDVAAPGVEGEIFLRGPASCVGFASVPNQTLNNVAKGGWIRSGDLGVIDADGFLTIVGRKKEIIIRGGMNVAPREVEELLLQHAQIDAAAVLGLPDPRLGEIVCACIVLKSGEVLDADDVTSHLRALNLAPYKLPSRIEFMTSLPMTTTGKVVKPELAAHVLARSK